MHRLLFILGCLVLAVAWGSRHWYGSGPAAARALTSLSSLAAPAADPEPGADVVGAARALLLSLDDAAREKATFAFEDPERTRWHFFPRERQGLSFEALGAGQRKLLDALLLASVGEAGAKAFHDVRYLESVLREQEGPERRDFRNPEKYHVSVFGTPSGRGRWGWRVEGHHLSLNLTLDGGRLLSVTPLFFGANPARVGEGPRKGMRLLAGVEDVARSLVRSLDDEARSAALGKKPEEIQGMLSPRHPGALPAGVSASDLSAEQRSTLRKLLGRYLGRTREDTRRSILEAIERAGPEKVVFAWRGGIEPGEAHSYVIHGPTFIAAYSNFQNGANHVHSVFRTRPADFALE